MLGESSAIVMACKTASLALIFLKELCKWSKASGGNHLFVSKLKPYFNFDIFYIFVV